MAASAIARAQPTVEVDEAATVAAQAATETADPGAWGTAIAILLAVGAATIGGMGGKNPFMSLPGSRAVVTTC
jgi:hypothetical protein